MAIWQWSTTATNNATADPTMDWQTGIPPSIITPNMRAMMAAIANWYGDIGGLNEPTGSPPTYVLSTKEGLQTPTPSTGSIIAFNVTQTNVGNDTLAVDGGNAYPICTQAGVPVGANVLIPYTPYTVVFNGTDWLLFNFYGQPFVVPIGAMMDWVGFAAPSSNFALPYGQSLNTTTYATLFNLIGYTYGGSGSYFQLPDVRGRVVAGLDNMGGSAAGRIGTVYSPDTGLTIVGTTVGSAGGSQTHVQEQTELAQFTPSGSVSISGTQNLGAYINTSGGTSGQAGASFGSNSVTVNFANASASFSGNTIGSSAAMAWLQPTMMLNKIIRII